jgi:hypothetical protein
MGELLELAARARAETSCFGHTFSVEVLLDPPLAPSEKRATLFKDGEQIGEIVLVLSKNDDSDIPEFGLRVVPSDLLIFHPGAFGVGSDVNSYSMLLHMQDFVLERLTDELTDKVVKLLYGKNVAYVTDEPPWNLFPTGTQRVAMAKAAFTRSAADDDDAFDTVVSDLLFSVVEDTMAATADWLAAISQGVISVEPEDPSERIKLFMESILAAWADDLDD